MRSRERLLQISYKKKTSHLGSCLTALPIIEAIYEVKKRNEKFVLSCGHAALALYVVLEKKGLLADAASENLGTHPDLNKACGIDCSTGSLGQGFPIAVGMAFADRSKIVYCLSSDGEMAEGSMWEALRIASDNNLINLKLIINANGYSAYDKVDINKLAKRIAAFGWNVVTVDEKKQNSIERILRRNTKELTCIMVLTDSDLPFAKGLDSHYKVMTKEDYNKIK